jgi:hypothetical protein
MINKTLILFLCFPLKFSKKSKFVKYLDLINISKMVYKGVPKQIIHEEINSHSSSSEPPINMAVSL